MKFCNIKFVPAAFGTLDVSCPVADISKHQSYVVVGLEREDGILVREGVHYVTVFDKEEERDWIGTQGSVN